MSERTLSCEEAMGLLLDYLDDELDSDRRGDMDHHLDLCRSCYSRHEFEKGLKSRVAELSREPVRAEFHERIKALVSQFGRDEPDRDEDPSGVEP